MKGLRWYLAAAALAIASLVVSGCGTNLTSSGSPAAPAAKNASVSFKMKFPQGGASKSVIDDKTAYIYVQWEGDYEWGDGYIEKGTDGMGSLNVQLYPGVTWFYASAYDANDNWLGSATAGGYIKPGGNTVVLSFLQGQWSLVDDNGNPTTIALGDGKTSISSFLVMGDEYGYAGARKGAFDPSKPYAYGGYGLAWDFATSTDYVTSYISMYSQFLGGSGLDKNATSISGGMFNVTRNTPDFDPSIAAKGDRFVLIAGQEPNEDEGYGVTTFSPDITQYMNTTLLSGTSMKGNIVELVFDSETSEAATGNTCNPETYGGGNVARAVTAKLAKTMKAGTSLGPLTVTSSYCYPTDGDGDGDYNNYEYYYDNNNNGVYDEGDTFMDYDGDGKLDWVDYQNGVEYAATVTFSDVTVHPFNAVGTQMPTTEIIFQRRK